MENIFKIEPNQLENASSLDIVSAVVKILDMIWMNQNFQGTANMDGDGIGFYLWSSYNNNEQEYYLYSADIVGISNVFPAGWVHLNHDKAIQKIIDFLN